MKQAKDVMLSGTALTSTGYRNQRREANPARELTESDKRNLAQAQAKRDRKNAKRLKNS